MEVTKRLHIGDRIRIQPRSGDEGPAVTITRMTVNGVHNAKKATKGDNAFIYCDRDIPGVGSSVFKIGESIGDLTTKLDKLPLYVPKQKVSMSIFVSSEGFKISCGGAHSDLNWSKEMVIEPAQKRALDAENISSVFSAADSDVFAAGYIDVTISGDLFIPASVLKEVRREFWDWAKENINPSALTKEFDTALVAFISAYSKLNGIKDNHEEQDSCLVTASSQMPSSRATNVVRSIYDFNKKTDEVLLPHFCVECRLENLERRIKEVYEHGIRRFRVTSLFQFELLKEYKDIVITVASPFPICNSQVILKLKELGANRVQPWLELEKTELEAIVNKSVLPVEIYRYGRPALLVTRAEVAVEGKINDSRSQQFIVEKEKASRLTYIYPGEVMSIPKIDGALSYFDLSHAKWNEKETSDFNFHIGLS